MALSRALVRSYRLDETTDCSQRPAPAWLSGGDGGGEAGGDAVEDDDMGDFMAEILAEEVSVVRVLTGGREQETNMLFVEHGQIGRRTD